MHNGNNNYRSNKNNKRRRVIYAIGGQCGVSKGFCRGFREGAGPHLTDWPTTSDPIFIGTSKRALLLPLPLVLLWNFTFQIRALCVCEWWTSEKIINKPNIKTCEHAWVQSYFLASSLPKSFEFAVHCKAV